MIGICIKAGFTCPDCDSYIPMNALVETLRCRACGTDHDITVDHWKTVLDDAIKEAPHSEEGEGSSTTVFGNFNYRIEYGRLKPRYSGTKDDIPIEDILEHIDDGYVLHPGTGKKTSIRILPDIYDGEFNGITALIGEDASLIPQRGEGRELEVENSGNPVALQCPNCGGSLIVQGDKRNETCRFCDTEVHLPDDLWKMLHPMRKAIRWYFLFDYTSTPFTWESDVFGGTATEDGGIALVVENDYGDMPILTCLRSDRTEVWMRDDLELECESDGSIPGAVADYDGNILIMHSNRMDLYSISLEDGSVTNIIKGRNRESDLDIIEPFNMDEVRGMTSFPDGSIMLLKSSDTDAGYYREFLRFDQEGNPLPLWKPVEIAEEKKPGFFARLFGLYSRVSQKRDIPYFEDIGDRPEKLKDSTIEMASGADGSLYLLHSERLAAFDTHGNMRYSVELPCSTTWGRPVANSEGEAFVLTEKEDDRYEVQRISAAGVVSIYAASVKDGGKVESSELIVLTSDGRMHVIGYGGVWITIDESSLSGLRGKTS
ncbi:MAG: hypothetical protein KAR44_09095 [Candidatus Aegiribacteria sp.]|nr:hypothetical protein [Candidatus Aegiribacteria sp.]